MSDFKTAIGVKVDIDIATGRRLSHEEIYGRAIEFLGGMDAVEPFIPYDIETLCKAYDKDRHFNTLRMAAWDMAAGFVSKGPDCKPYNGGLWYLYRVRGITSASCAEGVCVLKEAARRLVIARKHELIKMSAKAESGRGG